MSRAVKCDFRPNIGRYTSPNENFEYGYPHSNALQQFFLKFERCRPHEAPYHPTKCDVINDVKLFATVYHSICCPKHLTLSNQMSYYKSKCIRIHIMPFFDRGTKVVKMILVKCPIFATTPMNAVMVLYQECSNYSDLSKALPPEEGAVFFGCIY